jgi:hypothetical protein
MKLKLLLALAILLMQVNLHALPVQYEGDLVDSDTVVGSVGGFGWVDDDALNVDFWAFNSTRGARITVRATRLDEPLDLALSLFHGTTAADTSLFTHDADFGGMSFLTSADDEVEVPGPFGDPFLAAFVAPFTARYTIAVGGNLSDDAGPYRYTLSLQQQQPIPSPGTLLLVLTALGAFTLALRSGQTQPIA